MTIEISKTEKALRLIATEGISAKEAAERVGISRAAVSKGKLWPSKSTQNIRKLCEMENEIESLRSEIAALKAENESLRKDAERWIPVFGYVGYYEVSNKGRVRSIQRIDSDGNRRQQKYLHPSTIARKGYLKVTLWKNGESKEFYVHRLVATGYLPHVIGCDQVNHKDGDPANNESSNLEWVNNQQNAIHAARDLWRAGNKPVVGVPTKGGESVWFDSIMQAGEAGFKRANILKVINGERSHHAGYVWSFDAAMAQGEK